MAVALERYDEKNLRRNIERLFEKLKFDPQGRIFIKPNLGGRTSVRKGENTNPEFLEAIIDILLEKKCTIIIGHTSLLGTPDRNCPFEEVIKISGMERFASFSNVTLLNLDNCKKKIVESEDIAFEIPQILDEVDYYINLAKLKTHMQAKVSLSLKNQMGLLLAANRIQMHKLGLEKYIAYLGKIINPRLSLIDGIIGMEGNGPHHGKDKGANLIICGDDMVEVDSFATAMMSFDYREVEHICFAEKIGVGRFVEQEIINENYDKMVKFRPAERYVLVGRKLRVWPTSNCSRCMVAIDEAGKEIRGKIRYFLKLFKRSYLFRTDIIFGNCEGLDASLMDKAIGIGRCSENFCNSNNIEYLDRCPPTAREVVDFLTASL